MKKQVAGSATIKLLGKAQGPLAINPDANEVCMGKIEGTANSVFEKIGPNGEPFTGFKGVFAVTKPAHSDKDDEIEYRSSVCYLPDALHGMIAKALHDEEGNPLKGAAVVFSFNVFAKRDSNAAGFTWRYESEIEMDEASDPIAMMRAQIAARKQAALPAPSHHNKGKKHHKEETPAE
jgi:hypothetical protein